MKLYEEKSIPKWCLWFIWCIKINLNIYIYIHIHTPCVIKDIQSSIFLDYFKNKNLKNIYGAKGIGSCNRDRGGVEN